MRTSFRLLIVCALLAVVPALTAGPAAALVSTGGGGWSWLSPQPTGSYLTDAAFVDAQTGWAVGLDGVVLKTGDGGATWIPQQLPLLLQCSHVDFVDPLHGWILGERLGGAKTLLLRTADGGAHWTSRELRASSIDFASTKVGVAYDSSSPPRLQYTTDGGSTWTRAAFPAGFFANEMEMADATTGYAVGYAEDTSGSTVIKTSNGGRSWALLQTSSDWLSSLAASDADTVLLAGERTDDLGVYHQVLQLTTDGGVTWSSPPPPKPDVVAGDSAQINAIAIGGPDKLWAWWNDYDAQEGTATTRMSASSDGGETWSHVDYPWILSARCVGGSFLWALTGMTVDCSDDDGATWRSAWQETPDAGSLFALDVVGDSLWTVGDPSAAAHSADGGATWEQQPLPDGARGWRDVDFADAQNGWAVGTGWTGEGKLIAHTSDGGATWQRQTPAPVGYWLSSVCAVDPLTAYVGGASDCLMKTTDGGETWQALSPSWPTSEFHVYDIEFSTPLRGVVTGSGGYLLRTEDGGATWTYEQHGQQAINAIWRSPDGRRIWLAGSRSTLFFSGDGGQTWKTRSTGAVAGHWYGITFSDSKNGWLGGAMYADGEQTDPLLLHTSDGGVTWRLQSLGGHATPTSLVSRSAGTAFAVAGGLFVTTTGGARQSGDVKPPALTSHKPKGLWHNHRVNVTFTGTDRSGMRAVYARADTKWCARTGTSVGPAKDASAEGMHTVRGTGMDMAGNGGGTVGVKVGIDSSLPTTYARNSATTGSGGTVSLTYGVGDYKPGCGRARCTLRIATTSGRVVRSVSLGLKKTNVWYTYAFRASLPAGRYRWYVYARDIAGNPPHAMYYSKLTVGGGGALSTASGPSLSPLGGQLSSLVTGYQPAR